MKGTKTIVYLVLASFFAVSLMSCGGGGNKVKLSEKGELLISKSWKLQIQDVIDDATGNIEDTTGINADIKLDGDVGDFAEFLAETIRFDRDKSDKTKLAYSRKIGEGLLSSESVGYWKFNEDESAIIMTPWDSQKGELDPVTYEIVELTEDKLVLLKEGDSTPNIYAPK